MISELAAALAIGAVLGSIPFAILVGRLVLGRDPRDYGDGNPGAANVGRAGGRVVGGLAAVLDIAKGVTPVGLALEWGIDGAALVAVALVPVLAHVWSPWLRGRGGKGTATTYGVLIPLTLPAGPVAMPLLLVAVYRLVAPDGWAPVIALGFVALGTIGLGGRAEAIAAALVLAVVVGTRYADDLRQGIRLRRSAAAR